MTQRVGDRVLMSGPHQGGHWVDGITKKVGFVAAGTGITPMISIILWILTRRFDAELFLVFANKTEADIIFRDEWERYARAHPNFHPPTQGATAVKPWKNAQRVFSVALAKEACFGGFRPRYKRDHGCKAVGLHCYHVLKQPSAGWPKEPGESSLIFFDGIFLLRVQRPSSSSAGTTDDERPGRDTPRVRLSKRVCHPPVNRPPGIASERSSMTFSR